MSNYIENCLKLMEIPKGYEIFTGADVAGVRHYKSDALSFIYCKEKWLELKREPNNKYHKNAIAVIGCSKGLLRDNQCCIGYVPAKIAERLVTLGMEDKVIPRLVNIYVGAGGPIYITFQLLGPKEIMSQFKNN
jgi:hypothetical protein